MTDHQPLNRLLPQRLGMVVRLQAQAGRRAAVLDALHRYADHLADEPATELFVISLDPDEPDVVWLHEWFHGESGVSEHRAAPAFAQLMADLTELLVNPPGVMRFEPLRVHLAAALLEAEATSEF
jgi:quinol monooxygenase YgiN